MSPRIIMKLDVVDARTTGGALRLVLRHPKRPNLPSWSPGAHVDVRLPDGRVRQYSLCGDPDDATRYVIAVQLEPDGRGGSCWIHENLTIGSIAHVSAPRNHFPLSPSADACILIAGGIGITPLVAMAKKLSCGGRPFDLHYCARTAHDAPLLDEAQDLFGARLKTYFSKDATGRRFDAALALKIPMPDVHIYCCGPLRLVESVKAASTACPAKNVHVEMFAPPAQDAPPGPFDIEIASTGQRFHVPADRSGLSVLRENGYSLASSCEIGVCGSCECSYVSGKVIHRDGVLDTEQRRTRLLLCNSRAEGCVVLDL